MIGSLFWDEGKEAARKNWRESRVRIDDAISVRVPIRYGRMAKTRGNTFTMVLSMKADAGLAKVVPCTSPVNTFEDLLDEAATLWRVESQRPESTDAFGPWGCVALKVRDEANVSDEILSKWAAYVEGNQPHFEIEHAHDESPLLSASGLLQVPWPVKADGEPLTEVDALICTTNRPSLNSKNDYHDPNDVAIAWLKNKQYDDYFYKNREHGIKTFEDEAILEEIWKAHHGGCGGLTF